MHKAKKQQSAYRSLDKALNCLIAFLLVFAVATAPLVTPNLSYAKYVPDPIGYTITVNSAATFNITAIGPISGTPRVEETLTAGTVSPAGATVTWQWQRSSSLEGPYTNITGATTSAYTLTADDCNYWFKVIATGSGVYSGTITSASAGPVAPAPVTAVGAVGGTVQVGSVLTAGTVTPSEATVTWQWQRSNSLEGSYTNITGATGSTYTLTEGDLGYYIRVAATGTGGYTGTVTSAYVGPVIEGATSVTSIGVISGTPSLGATLTAGAVNPAGATVTWQWQRSASSEGPYTDIAGANSRTYTLTGDDYNCYVRVIVTGVGSYTGTAESAAVGPMSTGVITSIGAIAGSTKEGETLTAGNLTPLAATATYQWQKSWWPTGGESSWESIAGATSSTYTVAQDGSLKKAYIRVIATGTGGYTGTVASAYVGPVVEQTIPITSMEAIGGIARVEQTLTAGSLTPAEATATWQWQRSASSEGPYTNITGATTSAYTLTAADCKHYFRVIATGSGVYSGTIVSASAGPVAPAPVTAVGVVGGTVQVGSVLTAGAVTPTEATVTWQWQRSTAEAGPYENIPGAAGNAYTLTEGDLGYYIRVAATGTGGYTDTVTSAYVGPVIAEATSVTSIGAISGTTSPGATLTAGAVNPAGATVTWQWQRSSASEGPYTNITGATSGTYTLTGDDYNCYVRVIATGIGSYTGTAESAAVGPISTGAITAIGAIVGSTKEGETLTAGPLTPLAATATYQWQKSWWPTGGESSWETIAGATSSTYTVAQDGSLKKAYIRVIATGSGGYTGTVASAYVGPVAEQTTPLTSMGAINGIARVEETLTAGPLTPAEATATWQWQRSASSEGPYTNITGATTSAYTLTAADCNHYFRVIATGSGVYSGTITSASAGPVAPAPVTAVGAVGGTVQVGSVLTAGTVTPSEATVTWQWQRSNSLEGSYTNITGATGSTYTLTEGDLGYYIRVAATGTGGYTGTAVSAHAGPVIEGATPITSIGAIAGSPLIGETLTAGTVGPAGATVTWQWQRSASSEGPYTDIAGANSRTYTLTGDDYNCYVRVIVTGVGSYTGTAESAAVGPISTGAITAIGAIAGSTMEGETLTAGPLTPLAATATYQWQKSWWPDGGESSWGTIAGATSSTYTVAQDGSLNGAYIRVIATGSGGYTGTVASAYVGPVAAEDLQMQMSVLEELLLEQPLPPEEQPITEDEVTAGAPEEQPVTEDEVTAGTTEDTGSDMGSEDEASGPGEESGSDTGSGDVPADSDNEDADSDRGSENGNTDPESIVPDTRPEEEPESGDANENTDDCVGDEGTESSTESEGTGGEANPGAVPDG